MQYCSSPVTVRYCSQDTQVPLSALNRSFVSSPHLCPRDRVLPNSIVIVRDRLALTIADPAEVIGADLKLDVTVKLSGWLSAFDHSPAACSKLNIFIKDATHAQSFKAPENSHGHSSGSHAPQPISSGQLSRHG